jgi:hypothetical protein
MLMSYEREGWVEGEPARLTGRMEVRPAAELGPIIVCLDTSGRWRGGWVGFWFVGPAAAPRCDRTPRSALHALPCLQPSPLLAALPTPRTCLLQTINPTNPPRWLPAGSMSGAREVVAKAVALECMRGAHRQQRRCYLYSFRWGTHTQRNSPQILFELPLEPASLPTRHWTHMSPAAASPVVPRLPVCLSAAAPAMLMNLSWALTRPHSKTCSLSWPAALAAAQVREGLGSPGRDKWVGASTGRGGVELGHYCCRWRRLSLSSCALCLLCLLCLLC